METSKKTSEYVCQFQYRRSGINVKNARARFWRRMGILYIRSRIEGRGEGDRQDNDGMRIPTRSPRYLENKFKSDCNTVYLLSTCCGVLVGVVVVYEIVVWFLCYVIHP